MAVELEQHHRYSASGSEGWLNCPGKVAMESGIPDTYSPWADEGSAAHFLGSICLEKNVSPSEYLGKEIICWEKAGERDGQVFAGDPLPEGAVERSRWEVDEEMVTNITIYKGLVEADVTAGRQLMVEKRVHFGDAIGVKGAFGTSDAIVIEDGGEDLFVDDLKYGRKPVDATENTQGRLYAIGAIEDYGLVYDLDNVKRIWIRIIQPRINNTSTWVTSPEDLKAFAERCKAAVERSEEAIFTMDTPNQWYETHEEWQKEYLKYSEKGCFWCKAKGSCPAFAAQNVEAIYTALPVAEADLSDLPEYDENGEVIPATKALALPKESFESSLKRAVANVHTLDTHTLAKLYGASSLFDEFRDSVAQMLHNRLMAGEQHPDWKLVRGRAGNRKWSSPEEAEEVMKSMRLKADEMYAKKIISPADAEKLLAKTSVRKWNRISGLITRSEGKIALAPAFDKRDAYIPVQLPDLTEEDSGIPDDLIDLV